MDRSIDGDPDGTRRLRVLVLVAAAYFPPYPDELDRLNRKDLVPRPWPVDLPFDVDFLDQRFLAESPRSRSRIYRRLPVWTAQLIEAFLVFSRYDAVFAWHAEMVALPFALLLKLSRRRARLVALFGWISPPKKALLLKAVQDRFSAIVLPPSTQRDFARRRLGIPAEKLVDLPWSVDLEFWRPAVDGPSATPMICSAGREMRDYATLVEALAGTGIRCHIAGALVRGKRDGWRRELGDRAEGIELPAGVTVGPMSLEELRALYARSRFVVLPLRPSDTDNGISCMNEAWAMGKPVICSSVDGQRDALEQGVTGLFVPPGDAVALRNAILELWNDPERCERMGRAGREYVTQHRDIRTFTAGIAAVIESAAGLDRQYTPAQRSRRYRR